ncbi:hypothetical protein [Actinoplanes lobatus]|nr:hypothetical protein [Actinoplanes lobatus]MBB4750447.1 hypothetical protein [Actinoplanes lobatus]
MGLGEYPIQAAQYGGPTSAPKKFGKVPVFASAAVASFVLFGGAAVVLAVVAQSDAGQGAAAAIGLEKHSSLQDVQASCDPAGKGTDIADDGHTLIFDGTGEEDYSGVPYDAEQCVFDALKMPVAVQAHIGDTRALDGRQQESWDGITASWTYHPDDGLDMIIRAD